MLAHNHFIYTAYTNWLH